MPATAATITNFNVINGDSLDVSGLLASLGYSGSNPIGDGYLQLTSTSNNVEQLWADSHPGDGAWTLVASISGGAGTLTYHDGLLYNAIAHPGGTATNPSLNYGYDTVILTGSGGANMIDNGGQTVIDQGSGNTLNGGSGDDTLVFGPSTAGFSAGGGVDTLVLNANPTANAMESASDNLLAGDRIDVHNLLDGIGYTGSNPAVAGYLYFRAIPMDESHGYSGYSPYSAQLMWDPDGSAGPMAARPILTVTDGPAAFHYADGFFLVS